MLVSWGNILRANPRDWFDDTEFKRGKSADFSEITEEFWRKEQLQDVRVEYKQDVDGVSSVSQPRLNRLALSRSVA